MARTNRGEDGPRPVILPFLFFGNSPANFTKTDKNMTKNCHSRQGTQKEDPQGWRFLEKPAKLEEIDEIL